MARQNTNSGGGGGGSKDFSYSLFPFNGDAKPEPQQYSGPTTDSQDSRNQELVQDYFKSQRMYTDSQETYAASGGADTASQLFRSDVTRIKNSRFQLEPNPLDPSSARADAFRLASLKTSPPAGFAYKPWMDEHPQVALAGIKANLSADDWSILDRHFRLQAATQKLMIAASVSSPGHDQVSIAYAGMAPDIRDAALKYLQDFFLPPSSTSTPDANNPDATDKGWLREMWDSSIPGHLASAMFDQISAGIEAGYGNLWHAQRAYARANFTPTPGQGPRNVDGWHPVAWTSEDWLATEKDALDPTIVNELSSKYGAQNVQMLADINRAFRDNPKDFYTPLLTKYGNNSDDLFKMLDKFLVPSERDQQFNDLQAGLHAASNGSLSNMVLRGAVPYTSADNPFYQAAVTAGDIAASIVSDPIFIGSKALTVARIAKYGLTALAVAENGTEAAVKTGLTIDRLMSYRSVRQWAADMGTDARAYHATTNQAEKAAIFARMQAREDKVFGHRELGLRTGFEPVMQSREMAALQQGFGGSGIRQKIGFAPADYSRSTSLTQEIIDNRLFTPERYAAWVKSGEGLDLILNGHSAMRYPLMPRYSLGGEALRLVVPSLRRPVETPGAAKGSAVANDLFGADATGETLAANLGDKAKDLGLEVGVSESYKQFLGRRIPVGLHLIGEDRARGLLYARKMSDTSLPARARRLQNWWKTAPIKRSLYIGDGRDWKKVADWARFAGLKKQHVDVLAHAWVTATTAQRRLIAQGIAETTLHAHGIDAADPKVMETFGYKIIDGLNPGSQYGTRIPLADSAMSSEESRSILTGERLRLQGGNMTPEQRRAYLGHIMYTQSRARLEAQKDLAQVYREMSAVRHDARGSERLAELQDQANYLEQAIRENGRGLFDLIKSSGDEGRRMARDLGLEVIGDISKTARTGVKATDAAIRDGGDLAVSGVRDAGYAGVDYLHGVAGRGAGSAARAAKSDIRDAAKAGKDILGDVRDVNQQTLKDVKDAAASGRQDVRAAAQIQADMLHNTLLESRRVTAELKGLQRQIKDLSSKGRGMEAAALRDRVNFLQDRLDNLQDQARAGRWNVANLIADEEYTRRLASSTAQFQTYDPSLIDGVAHALHVRQTATRIRMPDLEKIQQIAVRTGVMDAMLGMSFTNWATSLVDTWSLITLAGPRFALRNSIEDYIFYDLGGGGARDLRKGMRASRATLMASGKKQNILPEAAMAKWRPYVTKDEVNAALKARKEGDTDAFRKLVATGMVRSKLELVGVRSDAVTVKHIDQLLESGYADNLLNEIAESARNIQANTGRGVPDSFYERMASQDNAIGSKKVTKFRTGGYEPVYRNLPLTDQLGHDAWWQKINDYAHGDGYLGRRAIQAVWDLANTPVQARTLAKDQLAKDLARIIEDSADKPYGYANIFSGVEASSAENFAQRYLDEALTVFSGSAGINKELVARLLGKQPVRSNGRIVGWESNPDAKGTALYDMVNGERRYRLSPSDLQMYLPSQKPAMIVGADSVPIPDVSGWQGATSSLWSMMGDQYNRITRQPMFYARYLQQRAQLEGYEKILASQFGEEAAAKLTTRLASDRAYEMLFAYTDNPGNRTMLAWNMRNLARYYRATEDFYRRTVRAVRFNPDRVVRDALLLHAMSDVGFIHTDDQGNKYFMYPNVFQGFNGLMKLLGVPLFTPLGYTGFKGQFNMVTPSADPSAWLPTFSGPLLAAPIAAIASIWHPFEEVQGVTLGQQSLGRRVIDQILPPSVAQIFDLMHNDEQTGKYANNLRNVIYGFAAHGNIPRPDATPDEQQAWLDDVKQQAEGLTFLQLALRFFVPASPNLVADQNMSGELASSGTGGLRPAFLKMVQAYGAKGVADPFKQAVTDWWRINPSLSIWTVAKSTDNSTAITRVTSQAADWIKANTDLVNSNPEAVGYLLPKDGQYAPSAMRTFRAYGMSVPQELTRFAERAAVSQAMTIYYQNRDDALAAIAAAPDDDSPNGKKALIAKFRAWKNGWDDAQGHHQGFMDKLAGYQNNQLLQHYLDTSDTTARKANTLDELSNDDPNKLGVLQRLKRDNPSEFNSTPTYQNMIDMIFVYRDAMQQIKRINGQTKADNAAKDQLRSNAVAWLTKTAGDDPRLLEVYRSLMESDLVTGGLV
jgi:hypothetical protein